ncbi:hypothetical protein ABWJ92_24100 [Streptomyces sp. NPDC000609]|uniref:hypothetical protein n=1 Tax=Streptomyces sp. NPDC000609 TaxID=3160957 RepID=UPI003396B6D2
MLVRGLACRGVRWGRRRTTPVTTTDLVDGDIHHPLLLQLLVRHSIGIGPPGTLLPAAAHHDAACCRRRNRRGCSA